MPDLTFTLEEWALLDEALRVSGKEYERYSQRHTLKEWAAAKVQAVEVLREKLRRAGG